MRTQATWLLALTFVSSPALTYGASPASTKSEETRLQLRNVELKEAGKLEGQLLTGIGQPVPNAPIIVRSQNDVQKIGQQLTTDASGRFTVTGLKSGTCIVESGDAAYAVRVWQQGTAPPRSLQTVAFVKSGEGETVRGNELMNRIRCMSKEQKICCGLLIAAAIAIPLALSDDDGS